SPAPGADTAGTASGGDGGESKTEIPPKDMQGEGETAQAGADGGVQNDAPQHVETSTESTPEGTVESESTPKEAGEEIKPAPKEDTSEGKEAKETEETVENIEETTDTTGNTSNNSSTDATTDGNSNDSTSNEEKPQADEPAVGNQDSEKSLEKETEAPLETAKEENSKTINEAANSRLEGIDKVDDESKKSELKNEVNRLKEEGLKAIQNAQTNDEAAEKADEYQEKIYAVEIPNEEVSKPNYSKEGLTNGRNEGTTIDNGSTSIGYGSGEATATSPTQPATEERSTSTASPTQPSSTSEGTSSFRRAGEYRATARRVARSVNEPEGTINISYNYDGMPDIHGFFADPGENNTVTVTNSTTEDKVKELVKAKIQAKAKELAKYGYTVKEEIIFEQDTTVKNFNYVVTFTKETTGFRNDNAPATGTPETQPENNRDMPVSAAGGADGGNQDTDAPKNTESQDGTEENAVSEDAGMPASPPSENAEHTEVATNTEGANPPSEAENSEGAGQDGMQADDGRQDAEEGLQGDDPAAHSPQDKNQQPQNAADNQPKTGVFGEKYFDGTGEITALVIGGETIDLTETGDPVSRNHPGLMSDFEKVMVSQGQYNHLIYGAAKLKDGSYTLFVQGKPTERLPEGKATYNGKVLHFKKAYENDWFNNRAYQAAGTFTANVDFSLKTVTGKIDTKDFSGMGMQEFTARIDGNGFQGKWKSDNDKGDISGGFYGQDGAEMAGRYDYKNQDNRKDGFGVFAGKKEADAR
ncbi:TPA: transferrin-binding protein-like solute binding protein, partial [Neisseria meningitidis]